MNELGKLREKILKLHAPAYISPIEAPEKMLHSTANPFSLFIFIFEFIFSFLVASAYAFCYDLFGN